MIPQRHQYDETNGRFAVERLSSELWAMIRASCVIADRDEYRNTDNPYIIDGRVAYAYNPEDNTLAVEAPELTDRTMKDNFAAPLRALAAKCAELDPPEYQTAVRLEKAAKRLADTPIEEQEAL